METLIGPAMVLLGLLSDIGVYCGVGAPGSGDQQVTHTALELALSLWNKLLSGGQPAVSCPPGVLA
ncbi:hypothetical protein CL655_04100 [bacterium]|nr:hypothetical protein [bacterium]|tara:strand:- start:4363 stop:4560 length:198 start_codon:yes stop_codon:yes gene_type:complete